MVVPELPEVVLLQVDLDDVDVLESVVEAPQTWVRLPQ